MVSNYLMFYYVVLISLLASFCLMRWMRLMGSEEADGPDTLRWDVESALAQLGDTR